MKNFTRPIVSLFLAFFGFLLFSNYQTVNAQPLAGGDGTALYPYRIYSCTGLQNIANHPSAYYVLASNIDCSATSTWNAGAGFAPVTFSGNLDGRNYTIFNLVINRPGTSDIGIFIDAINVSIKNLKITGAQITGANSVGGLISTANNTVVNDVDFSGSVTGAHLVGGLVGELYGTSTIYRSAFHGQVTSTSDNAGGLTGQVEHSIISDSYADADIVGNIFYGGISGTLFGNVGSPSRIQRSYANGSLTGGSYHGGIVAYPYGSQVFVDNSLSVTHLIDGGGAFFGYFQSGYGGYPDPVLSNNYFDIKQVGSSYCIDTQNCDEVTGISGADGDGNATYPFKNTDNVQPFAAWDFQNIWQVTQDYPTLRDATLDPIADLKTPSQVNNLVGQADTRHVDLTWAAPSDAGGYVIDDYKVEYKLSTDNDWTNYNQTGDILSQTVSGLTPFTGYDFRVSAHNYLGWGDSAALQITTAREIVAPSIPANVKVVEGNSYKDVSITWDLPADNGGADIVGYIIMIKADGADWADYLDAISTESSDNSFYYAPGYLTIGQTYDFRVQADNGHALSDPSESFAYTMPEIPVHHIKTCQDLQDIATLFNNDNNAVSDTIMLDNNIPCEDTVNWNQVSDSVYQGFSPINYFSGLFEGQGYEISGLYMNYPDGWDVGLFSELGNATIQDVKFSHANITGSIDVGIIAGYIDWGTAPISLDNIIVTDSQVTASTSLTEDNSVFPAGGFLGYLDGNTNLSITDSTFQGDVTSYDSAGGFVGEGDGVITIANCSTSGNVSAVLYEAGGFMGSMYGDWIDISSSSSTAVVTGKSGLGGFIGYNDNESYIETSTFSGSVTGSGSSDIYDGMRIGGLVGYTDYAEITDSNNTGPVTGTYRVGGLVGSGGSINIFNSNNSGPVTASYDGESSWFDQKGVGGLLGIAWDVNVQDSYNTGSVSGTGTVYVGGLAGAGSSVGIYQSFNSGSITGNIVDHDYNGVGGILGSAIETEMSDVYNDGTVNGSVRVGGIQGFAFWAVFEEVYNSGTVNAIDTEASGGLIGSNYAIETFGVPAELTVMNSFNTGEISSTYTDSNADYVGGIIGFISDDTAYTNPDNPKFVDLENNWWNNALDNGIGNNAMVTPQQPEVEGQYQKAVSKDWFVGNTDNAPLDQWNFDEVWYSSSGKYPIFNYIADIPVITIIGDNPAHVDVGAEYVDAGATASAALYGDMSEYIVTTGSVDASIPGTYTITYRVITKDVTRAEAERTVIVAEPEVTPTVTPTATPTVTPTATPIVTPTATPTVTPTTTPVVIATPTPTVKPTVKPVHNTVTPTPTEILVYILLNNFPEFLNGSGKLLSELTVGQVIYFNVDTAIHTATVKTVTDTYVIVTLASTPVDLTLNIGETKQADVTGDGISDVQVTLNSIAGGKADLTFVELSQPVVTALPNTGTTVAVTATPAPAEASSSSTTLLWCLLGIVLLGAGGLIVYANKNISKQPK